MSDMIWRKKHRRTSEIRRHQNPATGKDTLYIKECRRASFEAR